MSKYSVDERFFQLPIRVSKVISVAGELYPKPAAIQVSRRIFSCSSSGITRTNTSSAVINSSLSGLLILNQTIVGKVGQALKTDFIKRLPFS